MYIYIRIHMYMCIYICIYIYIFVKYIHTCLCASIIHVLTAVDGGATFPKDTNIKVKFWLTRMQKTMMVHYNILTTKCQHCSA